MNLLNPLGGDEEKEAGAPAGGAEEDEEDAGAADAGGSGMLHMKDGEYLLHVLIGEAKNIDLEGEDTTDPLIKVTFLGKTKETSAKANISRTQKITFDEHLFLETGEIKAGDFKEGQIKIQIFNKGFFKSDLIGEFVVAASKIYERKDHVLHNQWISFTNPTAENKTKVTGLFQISINMQGPGDEGIELKIGADPLASKRKPWMPASVKKTYKQLFFRFLRAEQLPIMDKIGGFATGTIDAYVKIDYQGNKLKTDVVTMGDDKIVQWDQEMMIPLEMPLSNDQLIFNVYDQDFATGDDLVCSMYFSIKDILKSDSSKMVLENEEEPDNHDQIDDRNLNYTMKWVNLFGSNKDSGSGKHAEAQNVDISRATQFNGRVLVEYYVYDCKHPEMKIRKIPKTDSCKKREQQVHDTKKTFTMYCEIGAAINLPNEEKEYEIMVCIGEQKWLTGLPKVGTKKKNGDYRSYNRWSKRFEEKLSVTYQSIDQIPLFFIYLMDDQYPICWWKGNVQDYQQRDSQFHWISFAPDLAIRKTQTHLAGLFQMKMYFHEDHLDGQRGHKKFDPKKYDAWKNKPPRRLEVFNIRCYIYQAESLPAKDITGASDPYIEVWQPFQKKCRTITCEQTNNPLYYQALDLRYEFFNLQDAPPVTLSFYDTDEGFFEKDDYMGKAVIYLRDIDQQHLSRDDSISEPKWYPVKEHLDDPDDENGPRVLVSFSLKDIHDLKMWQFKPDDVTLCNQMYQNNDLIAKIPIQMPDLDIGQFNVDITILGFRNLISPGILPINKAYAKFSVKSILPPAKSKAVNDIYTEPKETGSDPNIKTSLKFTAQIPGNSFYTPRMTCTAYDKLYLDFMKQPIIGTFTLKLGEILTKTRTDDKVAIQLFDDLKRCLNYISTEKLANQDNTVTQILNSLQNQCDNASSRTQPWVKRLFTCADQDLHDGVIDLNLNNKCVEQEEHKAQEDMTPQEREEAKQRNEIKRKRQHAKKLYADVIKLETERLARERHLAKEALKENKNATDNIMLARYKLCGRLFVDREVEHPPANIFFPIGYDKERAKSVQPLLNLENKAENLEGQPPADIDEDTNLVGIKHYRRYYPDELENVREVMQESPFMMEKIFRMKESGGGFFSSDDARTVSYEVGSFKGLVKVYNDEKKTDTIDKIVKTQQEVYRTIKKVYELQQNRKEFKFDFESLKKRNNKTELDNLKDMLVDCGLGPLKIDEQLSEFFFQSELENRLTEQVQCKVKLYMLSGFNFAKKDLFSESDPYLVLKCGSTTFDERANYQVDCREPSFYKAYEFNVTFPGACIVYVYAYDYDDFFGDDLIGVTKFDLDDRFYNKDWTSIMYKPIEYRDLMHSSSKIAQGVVKCWLEIEELTNKAANKPPLDITPEPVKDYEMRFIVWKGKDCIQMDYEGTSDTYVRCYLDEKDDSYTDTHWRCQTGKPSWNWRNVMKIQSQKPKYDLTIQGYDKDIFTKDEMVGSFTLDIQPLFDDLVLTDKPQALSKGYWDDHMNQELQNRGYEHCEKVVWESDDVKEECFWVPMVRPNPEDPAKPNGGYLLCSLRLYPVEMAKKVPQGEGQNEPNNDPFLPEPEGRLKLTLNPFDMFNQLIGPAVRRKIFMLCYGILCCALCVYMAPMIVSNGISKLMFG